MAPISPNIARARRQDVQASQQKPYQNRSFCKVFGCTPHLAKWSKMLPKSAPGLPKTGQVEAKIGPRPPKLRPRWESCCHLGPSWAILLPSWPILGATLRILAPALLDFFGNSSLHRATIKKKIPRAPSGPSFFVFWEPPDDDFHPFSCCVFLVFVSVYNNIVRIMDLLPCVHK